MPGVQVLSGVSMSLIVVHALFAWGVARLLRRFRIFSRTGILVGCLCGGVVAGCLAVLVWPADSVTLVNLPGVLMGDFVYHAAIRLIGDPSSSQAHFTIPWLFRVPQVYLSVSLVLWGLVGVVVQLITNRRNR